MCDYARFIPPRSEGRTRRHGRRAGCDGRGLHHLTRDAAGGRQRRVVPIPRRWDQVCRRYPASDGGYQARTPGRARYKPQNHCAGKAGMFRRTCIHSCAFCAFYLAREAAGATCIRLSLRPPRAKRICKTRALASRERIFTFFSVVIPRECGASSIPEASRSSTAVSGIPDRPVEAGR